MNNRSCPRPNRASLILTFCLVSSLLLATARAGAAESSGLPTVFNVRQTGATGDGKTLDTAAIQKALDDCGSAGGGIVEFPAGKYLSQPIVLHSRTTLQIDAGAVLQATDARADFENPQKTNTFKPFISGTNLQDVVIQGPGTIDGAGGRWWGPAEEARRKHPGYVLPRPCLIVLSNCTDVRVQDITLQNSPLTHLAPTACENVIISNVVVETPGWTANTDAIDPINCRHVLITKCRVEAGDDDICIKSTRVMPGREFASEDITVTDCVLLRGHGMSIGAATVGGVRNVTVRNLIFQDTDNGIRIKSQRTRGGIVEHIRFNDLYMSNVDPAITFTCYYMTNSSRDPVPHYAPDHDPAQPVTDTTPIFCDICVSNLTATCPRAAGLIIGLPESGITNVTLDHVTITAATTGLAIKNAGGLRFKDVVVNNQEGPPFIVDHAQVDGLGGR
jgi:polygalacturonase